MNNLCPRARIHSRICRIDIVDRNSSFDRSQRKSSRLLVFIFEYRHTTVLVNEQDEYLLQDSQCIYALIVGVENTMTEKI